MGLITGGQGVACRERWFQIVVECSISGRRSAAIVLVWHGREGVVTDGGDQSGDERHAQDAGESSGDNREGGAEARRN